MKRGSRGMDSNNGNILVQAHGWVEVRHVQGLEVAQCDK